jgi:hypothetical protein
MTDKTPENIRIGITEWRYQEFPVAAPTLKPGVTQALAWLNENLTPATGTIFGNIDNNRGGTLLLVRD